MQYVSAVSGGGEGVEYVKHVILESNPLLEAFGNAKTLRNNNSSRFGKYFEIHFNKEGSPCGGTITNYLLEKSRVVFQTVGERCFHIFYDLLSGASNDEATAWSLYQPKDFLYLSQSQTFTVDGVNDAEDYAAVRNAMNVINFSEQEQWDVMQLVAAILHLGNIPFGEDAKGNAGIADEGPLGIAAGLLGVEPYALQTCLTFRVMQTGSAGGRTSTYNVPQNYTQACGARDALAKSLYDRMFDFIVQKVNAALALKKMPKVCHIGVLDIFGFEIFQQNGFEQFCINYVNEKLQQYFIELTLKAEQEEYKNEGIKWEPIKFFNNQIVCDLIEGKKPPGLFSVLDDICYTVHAEGGDKTDLKFLQKAAGAFPGHKHLRPLDTAFMIEHYAGSVTYEVSGFCDKNKDTLFNDIIECMQTSTNGFYVTLFPEDVGSAAQKKRPTTAGFKIKTSAQALMQALSICSPHYIRCIKPNDNKAPNDFNDPRVLHQVKYLGLLENVRVRRAGWAYRSEFSRFLAKYKKLSLHTYSMAGEWNGPPNEGCRHILQDMNIDQGQWQLGKTKVFVRHPETVFHLEECMERRDYDATVRIQNAWKAWKLRKKALEQRAAAADLLRGKKERQRASVGRKFMYDYANYADNFNLQEKITQGETCVFHDQVSRLNRRSRPERRDLVITEQAVYLAMRQKKDGVIYYKIKTRTPLTAIRGVSLSTLQDSYFVLHTTVNGEGDHFLENEHKTEILMLLAEQYRNATRGELSITFNDQVTYKINTNDTRMVQFTKNESAQRPQIKKAGKTLTVGISSGLPRDTDTTPKSYANRGAAAVPRPAGAKKKAAPAAAAAAAPRPQPQPAAAATPQPAAVAAPKAAKPAAAKAAKPVAAAAAGKAAAGGRALPTPAAAGATAGRALPQPGAAKPQPAKAKPKPKPAAPAGTPARALFDYDAQTEDELSFREGDSLVVLHKDPGGWCEAEFNGRRGWVPQNYVEEC